jgi:hypothetical protein
MRARRARSVAILTAAACATVTTLQLWLPLQYLATEDRDGDGRPDVWRVYDRLGQLVEVDIDTNSDGRPDVEEYYSHGVLFRRASDRNFNGQIDLVEEFDADTHEPVRSLVDLDYDGTADVLLLFHNGETVFSKLAQGGKAAPRPRAPRGGDGPVRGRAGDLASLRNPFQTDTTIHTTLAASAADVWVGLSTSGGLPASRIDAVAIVSFAQLAISTAPALTPALLVRSPRGPPLT